MLMKMDESQRRAVEFGVGPLCIVAPPGSGKTFTLVERINYLVSGMSVKPERILAITFTNKAAGEMQDRLSSLSLGGLPYCSTFHALAYDIIKTHGHLISIPTNFVVVEDEKDKTEASITFDELISLTLSLLEDNRDILDFWQKKFDYILVDEYQDTDPRQDRIIFLLSNQHGNICVIGDPNQSIYGFRGASRENFSTFADRYFNAKKINLSTNYRSVPVVIQASSGFIGDNCPKIFRESDEYKIILKECVSPASEARWIVKKVEELIGGLYHSSGSEYSSFNPGDIAVLYRFNFMGKELEKSFAEAGIPYVLVNETNIDDIEFDTFRVPLMTMHAAKGLEFPVVFAAGLEDGVCPSFEFDDAPEDERLAEERRLFYVAMTRAKDRLFLSHTKRRNLFGKTYTKPSRFLESIPKEYIEREEEKVKTYQKKLF